MNMMALEVEVEQGMMASAVRHLTDTELTQPAQWPWAAADALPIAYTAGQGNARWGLVQSWAWQGLGVVLSHRMAAFSSRRFIALTVADRSTL
jgi:hypothetical protein